MRKSDIVNKIKVTRLNEEQIEKEMDELARKTRHIPLRDENEYLIYQDKYSNDRITQKIMNHGGRVSYYTTSIVPYYIVKQLSMNLESEVIYLVRKDFTDQEVENIEMSNMATRVILDCPLVVPDMSPYDLLFAVHDLKGNVDQIQISFPSLTEIAPRHEQYYEQYEDGKYYLKSMYKFRYFKYIQNSLSIWKMNIFILADSEEDYESLWKYIEKDKPGTRKKVEKKSQKEEGTTK